VANTILTKYHHQQVSSTNKYNY